MFFAFVAIPEKENVQEYEYAKNPQSQNDVDLYPTLQFVVVVFKVSQTVSTLSSSLLNEMKTTTPSPLQKRHWQTRFP